MKLLIKIYLPELNKYDEQEVINLIYKNIDNKNNTKICIVTNKEDAIYENVEYQYYLNDLSIPNNINYKLDEIRWDVLLPIIKPTIALPHFDSIINKTYIENFPSLDGVLFLNDNESRNIIEYPVVGKKYYNKFGYIFNPIYKYDYFKNEFTDVVNNLNKVFYVKNILVKKIGLNSDDENIYNLRKKINFEII